MAYTIPIFGKRPVVGTSEQSGDIQKVDDGDLATSSSGGRRRQARQQLSPEARGRGRGAAQEQVRLQRVGLREARAAHVTHVRAPAWGPRVTITYTAHSFTLSIISH